VPPSQCIVIEDSEHSVLGAYRAGMRIIHIPDLAKPSDASLERAMKVFDSAVAGSDYIIRMAIRGV
jgi:beta-phosphoglucomutase-like phosphatase (HAD superfamily)